MPLPTTSQWGTADGNSLLEVELSPKCREKQPFQTTTAEL